MKSKKLLKNSFITVALVLENTTIDLEKVVGQVFGKLNKIYEYFEILIVDNHIGLKSAQLENICSRFPNVRCIVLSRGNSREVFYNVILENALGDYLIILDPQSYPIEVVDRLMNTALNGFEMVMIVRKNSIGNRLFDRPILSAMRFVFKKLLGIDFRPQKSFNGLLARSAINSIIKVKNKKKFLRYCDHFVGLSMETIRCSVLKTASKTKIHSIGMLSTALDVLITNSQVPLRLASLFGLVASFLSFSFLVYALVISIVKKRVIEGWITTSIVTGSLFFIMFLILTILSEYISRILSESKDEPLYFISKEFASTTTRKIDKKKINVVRK